MATTHRVGGRLATLLTVGGGMALLAPVPLALLDERRIGNAAVVSVAAGCWAILTCRRRTSAVAFGRVVVGLVVLGGLAAIAVAEGLPISGRGLDPWAEVVGALLLVAGGSLAVVDLGADEPQPPASRPTPSPSGARK